MSSSVTTNKKRAYIGNLRPRPNLSTNLFNDLFMPRSLHVKNFPNPGTGIVVVQPKLSSNNYKASAASASCYALVEFNDVDYAISVLNGIHFDGRILRVSKEKSNFGGDGGGFGSKGKFGSSRWAKSGSGNAGFDHDSISATNKHASADKNIEAEKSAGHEYKSDETLNADEAIVNEIESLISSEFKANSDDITTAIACTAAMTLLSSVNAFGLEEEKDELISITDQSAHPFGGNDQKTQDFQLRCKMPLSDLLAEYGDQDGDWKKQQHQKDSSNGVDFQGRRKMPLLDLMAEYGDQDVNWKKDPKRPSMPYNDSTENRSSGTVQSNLAAKEHIIASSKADNNMLAPFGKAFIHLELVSFGYKYGAPPHSKKGFSYAHPLPPLDVRDLDRAPGHIAKFNGLSYLVKRSLLNPSKFAGIEENGQPDDEGNIDQEDYQTITAQSPMRLRANRIADEIIKVLVESIDEGGHGAMSPLTMTISIGSEYGRHRSVVLVEHIAVVLRARLRRNDGHCFNETSGSSGQGGNGIVRQQVSVGTRHRDIEARHQDEEAFGEDLKREARKVERAKKRDMWDDDGW